MSQSKCRSPAATTIRLIPVLTKCDKVKPGPLTRLVEETSGRVSKHVAAHPELIVTSSAKGTGIEHLRSELAKIAEFR